MNNLFQVDENSIEQYFAANIVYNIEQYMERLIFKMLINAYYMLCG